MHVTLTTTLVDMFVMSSTISAHASFILLYFTSYYSSHSSSSLTTLSISTTPMLSTFYAMSVPKPAASGGPEIRNPMPFPVSHYGWEYVSSMDASHSWTCVQAIVH